MLSFYVPGLLPAEKPPQHVILPAVQSRNRFCHKTYSSGDSRSINGCRQNVSKTLAKFNYNDLKIETVLFSYRVNGPTRIQRLQKLKTSPEQSSIQNLSPRDTPRIIHTGCLLRCPVGILSVCTMTRNLLHQLLQAFTKLKKDRWRCVFCV